MVPMVFAAFANDSSKSLSLMKEREALMDIFNDFDKVELKILDNADFDIINRTIINEHLQERIVVFHYGGHSDGKNINLANGNVQAKALAMLLHTFPNLQLVFLNGCDTYDLTGSMQKEGIKAAIITTIKPLNDTIAIQFARYFYYAFYRFNSLNDSFVSAEIRIIAPVKEEMHFFLKLDRGMGIDDEAGIKKNLDDSKMVYILTALEKSFLKKTFSFDINYRPPLPADFGYRPNRVLIESLTNNILTGTYINEVFRESKAYQDLERSFGAYSNDDSNRNFSLLVRDVLALLPFPLSFHISILKANALDWDGQNSDKKNELLKRQIVTYNSMIQLLTFTLLSSFWSELDKKKDLDISTGQWKVIKNFLSSNELNNQDINYPVLLVTIREIFETNNLDPFISEYQKLKNIFDNEEDFFNTHLHMQGLKSSIANGEISKMNVNWLCFITENMLSVILSKTGFVIKYTLTTVKNIEISKSRLKKPFYYIQRIILDGATVEDDDIAVYDTYTDSRSVILARGIDPERFTKFLSLSPFIIDENALRGENLSRLFFYSYSDGDNYVYRWAEDPDIKLKIGKSTYPLSGKKRDPMIMANRRMEAIKDELDAFKDLINPQK